MQLSLLSALARLDMDPWQEAGRLADLPREAGTKALAAVIAQLPAGLWEPSDAPRIAARLIRLLPNPPRTVLPGRAGLSTRIGDVWAGYIWILLLVMGALILFR